MKILIFGLPGSGKSTLAEKLSIEFNLKWYNADQVRKDFNDWDFSVEGRLRQADRMLKYSKNDNCIIDFVCPYDEYRNLFDMDIKIWMNTIESGRFEDTNQIFQKPTNPDVIEITSWVEADKIIPLLKELINE